MKKTLWLIIIAHSFCTLSSFSAENKVLKMNQLFSDHMVLQQKQKVDIWGECAPLQKVTFSASWGVRASTKADVNGKWKVKLATPKAGGPYTIEIKTKDHKISIKDVLIGEVWLAAGQSNMDISLKGWFPRDTISNSAKAIAQANYPNIRFLKVPFNISATDINEIENIKWIEASPQTVGDFSAVAYFYAQKLSQELNVPIGIIQSSIGGTPAEAWTSKESLTQMGDFNKTIDGLGEIHSRIQNWFSKWNFTTAPRTDEQWQNLQLSDETAAKSQFDDSKWENLKLPGRFDRLSSGEFDGVMWIRRTFDIQDITTDYTLHVGSVDDMDKAYINGKNVGGIMKSGFASTPREMLIPKSLLVKGTNIIAMRLIDSGGPGFVNGPITISNNNGVDLSLAGEWKSQLIAENVNTKFYIYNLHTNLQERPNISILNSNTPTVLFNAMINPLIPYTIKGAIWYQGESNVGRAEQYKTLFPLMIKDWRQKWSYDFPFYYVQIAPYLYGDYQKEQSQKLRDAQRYALELPKTGMVVTLDLGLLSTVHPPRKQEVADRLARFAFENEYGKPMVTTGPLFKQVVKANSKLIIEFDSKSVGSGLVAAPAGLTGFEIAGADKVFVTAQAKIVANKIELSNSSVNAPLYARYAWSDGFFATLFNKEGLPASTFSSEK